MNSAASSRREPSVEEAEEYGYLELLSRVKKALDTGQEIRVPASDIRPYPTQPREYFNDESIRRLGASIDAGGQTSSGMIREKPGVTRYELIDGERRWRAICLIPQERRPLYRAKLIVAEDDVVQYLISGITNFNREGHTPLETMKTIDRHVEFGFPMKEIAALLGISEHWAYQIHGLKKLAPEVRAMLNAELPKPQQLPVTAAIHIAKIESKFQLELAQRVISKDVTLGRLRGEVVRVAKKEGMPVRTREVEPHKQWESFGNKIDLMLRTAGDAEELIGKRDVAKFVTGRPTEAGRLLAKLADAKETLSQIESKIRQARR